MPETAKLFSNGGSQAVRLPRQYRFDDSEVLVKKIGEVVLLMPKNEKWSSLLMSLGMFTDDFMKEPPEDLPVQERETL